MMYVGVSLFEMDVAAHAPTLHLVALPPFDVCPHGVHGQSAVGLGECPALLDALGRLMQLSSVLPTAATHSNLAEAGKQLMYFHL